MRRTVPSCRRLAIFLLCCLFAAGVSAAERGASYLAALESITASELQGHVEYLADDRLEGRKPGTAGSRAAAAYLARQFAEAGLTGAGADGAYYQHFRPDYRNVLAVCVGSDPQLRSEVVIVGAHYDHVGYGTRRNSRGPIGRVHNGADDNASGTAALLEVAGALQMLPESPKRSVLLIAFDGEEIDLLGAAAQALHRGTSVDARGSDDTRHVQMVADRQKRPFT